MVANNENSHIVHGRKEYRLESTAIVEIQKKVDSSLGVKVQNTDSLAVISNMALRREPLGTDIALFVLHAPLPFSY